MSALVDLFVLMGATEDAADRMHDSEAGQVLVELMESLSDLYDYGYPGDPSVPYWRLRTMLDPNVVDAEEAAKL